MAVFIFLYKLKTKTIIYFLLFSTYQTSFLLLETKKNGHWKLKTKKKKKKNIHQTYFPIVLKERLVTSNFDIALPIGDNHEIAL